MALNNNLNGVLDNIVHNVSPVIKLSNGLYTLVDKNTIIPDETSGTNLIGKVIEECITIDTIIKLFKLLGSWQDSYIYDSTTNTWRKLSIK